MVFKSASLVLNIFFSSLRNVEYMHNFLKSRPLEQEGGWRGVVGQMGWQTPTLVVGHKRVYLSFPQKRRYIPVWAQLFNLYSVFAVEVVGWGEVTDLQSPFLGQHGAKHRIGKGVDTPVLGTPSTRSYICMCFYVRHQLLFIRPSRGGGGYSEFPGGENLYPSLE